MPTLNLPRVGVADPLPLFRHGVESVLTALGYRPEAPDDLVSWVGVDEPRVLLFTVQRPDDWALLPELCQARAVVRVIAVLGDDDVSDAVRALSAGAAGVLRRDSSIEMLRDVLEAVVQGSSLVPLSVIRALTQGSESTEAEVRAARPSSIERDWLRLLASGEPVARIATRAGYSERMMFRLLRDLYDKIGAESRTDALIKARDAGWL